MKFRRVLFRSRLRLRKTGSELATHLITRYASRMNDKPDAENTNDCIIPPEVPKTELRNLVSEQSEHEVREIVDYIEWQCNKKREHALEETGNTELVEELVQHAEKIKTDRKSKRLNSDHQCGHRMQYSA